MDEGISQTENKRTNPIIFIGILGALVIIGATILLAQNNQNASIQSGVTPTQQPEPTQVTIQTPSDQIKVINLEAGSFYYTPKEIRVKRGEKVKIVMTSKDMMHDFNIDELDVKIPITKSGNTSSVEFMVNRTGSFQYYCSVGQHRANGQIGMLIVE